MKISDAYRLLSEDGVADHARYFNDLYKQHDFKESDELKNYFEFVLHEPELWLKSFPTKLKSKPAFSKPKTAVLKLLRNVDVVSEYGKIYCENAHDVIDSVYKKNVDAILETRGNSKDLNIIKEEDEMNIQPIPNKISHIIDTVKMNNIVDSAKVEINKSEIKTPHLSIDKNEEVESVISFESMSFEKSEEKLKEFNEEYNEETHNIEKELRELQKKYRVLKKAYEELAKGTLNPSVVASIQTIMSLI